MKLTEYFSQWQNLVYIAFCIITFIQVFYYLFFFKKLAFYKSTPGNISQTHPVSVIICSRDEAENLTKNLTGSLEQQYKTTHEIIVVNDNSFDESKYILKKYQKDFKQLQVIELTQEAKFIPGKKFPLSIGVKKAAHEILLLTDADCVPASKFWIEKMQEGFSGSTEIVLGYGAMHKKKGFFNKLIRWETFHTALQYFSYAAAGLPYMGVGRNLSYKKSLFFRHKGFSSHNQVAGGDDDLFVNKAATRNNTAIVIDKDAFTLSEPPKTWKQWKRQKNRHYTTSKYYKPIHKFLLGLYALSHFLFYPLFVVSLLFYNWQQTLIVFAGRFILQGIILYKTTEKLDEKDLFTLYLFMDIWMFFYYIIFSASLFKKPKSIWK